MTTRRVDPVFIVSVSAVMLMAALAGFISNYTSRQSGVYVTHAIDEALGGHSSRSQWTIFRNGYVLGRTEPKNDSTSYVVVARRPDGEMRIVINVDADGSILATAPLGSSNGFPYARRLGVLFQLAGGSGIKSDVSPLDAALKPLVVHALETITKLERTRLEKTDGN